MSAISDAIERILVTYYPLDENGTGTIAEGIEDCLPDEGYKIVPLADDLAIERARVAAVLAKPETVEVVLAEVHGWQNSPRVIVRDVLAALVPLLTGGES